MLQNKIAQSGLIVLDLEDYLPKEPIQTIDISQFLFKGLILREKEFRAALKAVDWAIYQDKVVTIYCSTDAIVPQWAYMLVTSYLINISNTIFFGDEKKAMEQFLLDKIESIDIEQFREERVIIKGCGKLAKTGSAYVAVSKRLLPIVKTLMFGEPCSTVPVYKKR